MTALASGRYGGHVETCPTCEGKGEYYQAGPTLPCEDPRCVGGWVPVDATDRHDCYTWTLYCPICDRGTIVPLWARVVCLGDKVLTLDGEEMEVGWIGPGILRDHPEGLGQYQHVTADARLIVDDLGHRPEELRR